jgi:hypothetical protein
MLADPDWIAVVQQALDDSGADTFERAIWPATKLGLPIQEQVTARLADDPYNVYLWQSLSDTDAVIVLAERLLPLAELATGPADDDGVGADHAADRALERVADRLTDRPDRGWPLIRVALANRMTRSRSTAVRVLGSWPHVPAEAREAVRSAAAAEPDDELRGRMLELLGQFSEAAATGLG